MLQFVSGPSGTGKSEKIRDRIKALVESGEDKLTLIVPEQFSFTCHKDMLALVGARDMQKIDVLPFTKLSEKLIGKPALYERRRLSDTSAAVLMSLALRQVKDELTVYGKTAGRPSSVKEFLSLSSELKQNLITPDMLSEVSEKMSPCLLKAKLADIALIMRAYNEKVESGYFDPEDLMTELAGCEGLDAYMSGRYVFIDSFRGFTAGEYAVIERMLISAKEVCVALCTDGFDDEGDITDFFAKTKNTAARIARLARKNGVAAEDPVVLTAENCRITSPELAFLEKALRSPVPGVFEGECGAITLCRASNTYLECEYVAATVKKLIREQGYRRRDIAVIARNIEPYRIPLTSALKKYGIRIFEDYRKAVDVSPVMNAVSSAVRACADSLGNESLMRYIKTGLTGLDTQEISLLENYCYTWQISGRKWLSDWTQNPGGFTDPEYTDEALLEEQLEELNALRVKVITPVAKLKDTLSGGINGKDAAAAIWKFITDIKLSDNVKTAASALVEDGEEGAVLEMRRTWKLLAEMLDEMSALLESEKVTASSLADIIDLMLSCKTVGSIPQGLDDITIGSADRIRVSAPRAVFVIGANEGVFPPDVRLVSSLTLKDRKKLEDFDIKLSDSGEWRIAEENLIAYSALCAPREKLFVTCACSGRNSDEMVPGELYKKIKACFPLCKELDAGSLGGEYYAEGRQSAFEQFAASVPGEFRATMQKYFAADGNYSGKLSSLERVRGGRNFGISDPDIAARLFGRNMFISPSKIEKYYKCAFSYFCEYGIKAKPRKQADFDPIQIGNVSHKVLELLLKENTREELSAMDKTALRGKIDAIMDDYYVTVLGNPDDKRLEYLYSRIGDSLVEVAERLIYEFSVSSFTPVDFELQIGDDGEVPAYTPEGAENVNITGKIDRVDICEDGGKTYLRIVDYKTGDKDFDIRKAVQGLDLQMLVYLFTLWQNGRAKYGENIVPAGILYFKASAKAVDVKPDASEEKIYEARIKSGKMAGMVLKDERILNLMEKGAAGVIVPAGISSKGEFTGSVINLDGLTALKKRTDKLIAEMASLLRSGKIDAVPCPKADLSDYNSPCKYCDFRCVCGFEEDIPARELPECEKKDVTDNLENGGDGIVNTVE